MPPDVLAYFIRAQNAAIIFRKYADETVAESFEVSPCTKAVMGSRGKLVCSYPGPAIAVPNKVFKNSLFTSELAHFLCRMDEDDLDAAPKTYKAGSTVVEERDTVHPRYITELLTGILRGVGKPADIQRITKRIGDDVVWNDSRLPWRRSPLWLVIRVVIQTTLERNSLDRDLYKPFILFFMNGLAQRALHHDMSNDVLQWIVTKISRRLMKMGDLAQEWLSVSVLDTCTNIRTLLDERWQRVQAVNAVSPLWTPFILNISADAWLPMLHSSSYINNVSPGIRSALPSSPFVPRRRMRATLNDFLSVSCFQATYKDEPNLTLYDVEREISLGIDKWVMGVPASDIDSASEKLELFSNSYSTAALQAYKGNPEDTSRMLLTLIELWIALDKLVVRQIPILADYSPELPTSLLECLLLRHPDNLLRCRLAFQYIRGRHAFARRGWSVFSDLADENCFPVRYYMKSPNLQALKYRIVQDAKAARAKKCEELQASNALHAQLQEEEACAEHDYHPINGNHSKKRCEKCKLEKRTRGMYIRVHEWCLPTDSCRAAVVVFELRCPVAFNMWRSLTLHLLVDISSPSPKPSHPYIVLEKYPDLHPYYAKHARSRITLASDAKPFALSHYRNTPIPSVEDRVCVNNALNFRYFDSVACTRLSNPFCPLTITSLCSYHLAFGPYQNLQQYLQNTTHTSNDVICNQADCHKDLSIHEFIAFGHLRSGPSLQWLNILREIRANTLSFRREEVHMLIAQAACQIGSFSSSNGEMDWHHELTCSSFCCSLLTELENLVATVSGNWLEGMTMNSVSLLVSRLLAGWLPIEDGINVAHQACRILRAVREKTFSWVVELLEALENAPDESAKVDLQSRLRDTAAICRSTFDVWESNDGTRLLDSSMDVEILFTCAIIVHDNTPAMLDSLSEMSRLLLERDRRLSWKLQHVISDLIVEKVWNTGIHLAVKRVWPTYRQGSQWRRYDIINCSWLTSSTLKYKDEMSQQVWLDILDGSLLVDGKATGRLPHTIQRHSLFTSIFPNVSSMFWFNRSDCS